MATSVEFIESVCEKISPRWEIRYKKMFGEYMVYVNDKPIFTVCDNTVYAKRLSALSEVLSTAKTGSPYEGAKEHYIVDDEDAALINRVVEILEPITPLPKKRDK